MLAASRDQREEMNGNYIVGIPSQQLNGGMRGMPINNRPSIAAPFGPHGIPISGIAPPPGMPPIAHGILPPHNIPPPVMGPMPGLPPMSGMIPPPGIAPPSSGAPPNGPPINSQTGNSVPGPSSSGIIIISSVTFDSVNEGF